jgi:hypothetical protein
VKSAAGFAMALILLAAMAVAVVGCSVDTEKDLAACKVKAMELYKPENAGEGQSGDYLRACMRAAGYLPDWTCPKNIWDMATCYYPDTWWWRWFIGDHR